MIMQIEEMLENHKHWLNRDCEGCEDMRADLQHEDLQHEDLQHEDLDYSSLPLWCGGQGCRLTQTRL